MTPEGLLYPLIAGAAIGFVTVSLHLIAGTLRFADWIVYRLQFREERRRAL